MAQILISTTAAITLLAIGLSVYIQWLYK